MKASEEFLPLKSVEDLQKLDNLCTEPDKMDEQVDLCVKFYGFILYFSIHMGRITVTEIFEVIVRGELRERGGKYIIPPPTYKFLRMLLVHITLATKQTRCSN